jgi:hypothetical protein
MLKHPQIQTKYPQNINLIRFVSLITYRRRLYLALSVWGEWRLANIRISGKEVAVDYFKALSLNPQGGIKEDHGKPQ